MKKIKISILSVICIFIFIMQIAHADHDFTDLSTIKTWVADKYCNDVNLMEKIRILVGETTFSKNKNKKDLDKIFKNIPQDENVKKYAFGKTFPTIMAVELPFLQYVKEISKNKEIITLEIAAARGYVSWKIPLAFENSGTHYANDFSSTVIKQELKPKLTKNFNTLGMPDTLNSIKTIEGSCFNILQIHPELKNKVDVIYVQNLEHFLNPRQHIAFIRLIEELLAPNGKAFLCAHSPSALKDAMDDRMKKKYHELTTTIKSEKNGLYPVFVQYDMEYFLNVGSDINEKPKISNIKILDDYDIEVGATVLKHETDAYGNKHVVHRMISNYFTPQMYRQIISVTTDLELEDAFYGSSLSNIAVRRMDCENWFDCDGSSFVIAVVKKPE